jgi:hypothetical protein
MGAAVIPVQQLDRQIQAVVAVATDATTIMTITVRTVVLVS